MIKTSNIQEKLIQLNNKIITNIFNRNNYFLALWIWLLIVAIASLLTTIATGIITFLEGKKSTQLAIEQHENEKKQKAKKWLQDRNITRIQLPDGVALKVEDIKSMNDIPENAIFYLGNNEAKFVGHINKNADVNNWKYEGDFYEKKQYTRFDEGEMYVSVDVAKTPPGITDSKYTNIKDFKKLQNERVYYDNEQLTDWITFKAEGSKTITLIKEDGTQEELKKEDLIEKPNNAVFTETHDNETTIYDTTKYGNKNEITYNDQFFQYHDIDIETKPQTDIYGNIDYNSWRAEEFFNREHKAEQEQIQNLEKETTELQKQINETSKQPNNNNNTTSTQSMDKEKQQLLNKTNQLARLQNDKKQIIKQYVDGYNFSQNIKYTVEQYDKMAKNINDNIKNPIVKSMAIKQYNQILAQLKNNCKAIPGIQNIKGMDEKDIIQFKPIDSTTPKTGLDQANNVNKGTSLT